MKGTFRTDSQFQILHQLPGRLRVKMPALRYQDDLADDLVHYLLHLSGVYTARANTACDSLTVTFAPALFDAQAWFADLDLTTIPRRIRSSPLQQAECAHQRSQSWHWSVANLPLPLAHLRRRTFQFEKAVPPKAQFILGAAGLAASILELPAVITGSILVAAAAPIVNRALQSALLENRVGADALDSTTCALLIRSGHYFPAAVMTSLIGLGELMRHLITEKCEDLINHQLALSDRSAWLIKVHQRVRTPLKDLKIGDRIAIYPGEMVPCAGGIVSGKATVVYASPDMDYAPRCVTVGEHLDNDLLLIEGKVYLVIETLEPPIADCTPERHFHEKDHLRWLQQTKLHRRALKSGYKAVLPLISIAGLTFLFSRNVERALSIICFDFITGAKIAIPTAVLSSMYNAGNKGIVIKNAGALEILAEIDTVVFARSGILTALNPIITDVLVAPEFTLEQVTVYAAAVERRYDNMAAYAIYNYAPAHNTPIPDRTDSSHITGLGVEGTVEGHKVLVGRTRLMRERDVDLSGVQDFLALCLERGESRACVAIDGKLAAVIAFNDPLRADVQEVVTALGDLGVSEIAMITGVSENAAQALGEKAGISRIYAKTMPEEQAQIVRDYRRKGRKVAVVGHDVDDILALEHADLAITLGNSSDVARLRADIVLTSENLSGLVEGIKIARKGMRLAKENIAIVTAPNFLGLGLAAMGSENFLLATTLNNGSVIIATTNGLRPTFENSEDKDDDDNQTSGDYDQKNDSETLIDLVT